MENGKWKVQDKKFFQTNPGDFPEKFHWAESGSVFFNHETHEIHEKSGYKNVGWVKRSVTHHFADMVGSWWVHGS